MKDACDRYQDLFPLLYGKSVEEKAQEEQDYLRDLFTVNKAEPASPKQ